MFSSLQSRSLASWLSTISRAKLTLLTFFTVCSVHGFQSPESPTPASSIAPAASSDTTKSDATKSDETASAAAKSEATLSDTSKREVATSEVATSDAATRIVLNSNPYTTLIVVVGAGGSPEYTEQFQRWAQDWAALAKQQNWQLVEIGTASALSHATDRNDSTSGDSTGGDSANQNSSVEKVGSSKPSDLQKLQAAIEQFEPTQKSSLDESASQNQRLWVVLIGHGTSAGRVAKFNLTGPDVTTTQMKTWLDRIQAETIVIDCTSSSAPFLVELSAKNRIIVSATRSGSEVNFARFGGFLAAAVRDLTADLDHDNEVSLLEAFLKASKETERFYRENARLATEHAILEDNSDKAGTGANFYVGAIATTAVVSGKSVDGKRASKVILWSAPNNVALTQDQVAQRAKVEAEIDKLREKKSKLAETDYYDQLEQLMLQMAEIYAPAESK